MIIVDNVYGKFNGKKLYKATTFSLCSCHVTRGVVFDTNDVSYQTHDCLVINVVRFVLDNAILSFDEIKP